MSRFLISCGGTGGHLSPGIALAEGLRARGHQVVLLISHKKVDTRLIEKYPHLTFERIPGAPFTFRPVGFVRFVVKQTAGLMRSVRLVRNPRPDAIVGFGGFTTAAIILAGAMFRVPVALHEANRVPGRAIRLLGRLARRVYVPPGVRMSEVRFSALYPMGLPVRPDIVRLPREVARQALGLDPQQPVLVVLGGSQGASKLNEWSRQRAEALALADHRKDEFLAMLAHELRNPLSAILTAARLMQMKSTEAAPRLAQTIERQTHHLARLVDDLLEVSRITHGKIQLKLEPTDLIEAVKRSVETAKPTLARHRNEVSLKLPEGPLLVNGDATRIDQIVGNLLTNAAKYTNDAGHIEVNVERLASGKVRVDVIDDGVGLSQEDCAHVFELFYQANTSIARSQSGLGIGLTMVHRLVEMHGGAVSVQSDGPGKGCCFSVELTELLGSLPRDSAPPAEAPTRGTRVLFVDDNVDACELMRIWLESVGCVVISAHDGGEAVRAGLEHRFDVAVLDIGLPVMDGYELAGHLRRLPGLAELQLIALTGYGQESDRQRAREAGFHQHLVKPVDVSVIEASLARARPRDLAG